MGKVDGGVAAPSEGISRMRLDKWLWAARFFKTRTLAAHALAQGRVEVNGLGAKASREIRTGDLVAIREPGVQREVVVTALSEVRGPAPVAQTLYAETAESVQRRLRLAQERRLGLEPALTRTGGRPTKRDRRALVPWERWSASADPDK